MLGVSTSVLLFAMKKWWRETADNRGQARNWWKHCMYKTSDLNICLADDCRNEDNKSKGENVHDVLLFFERLHGKLQAIWALHALLTVCRNIVSIQDDPKIWPIFVRLITSSNIDQFSNFFTVRIRRKFVVSLILLLIDASNVSLHYLVKCQCLQATVENKASVQKETTCLLSQLLSKVTVTSCSFYIKYSMMRS